MKQLLHLIAVVGLIILSVTACNNRPKVVSPIEIPHLDSLKTFADKVNKSNDPEDQFFAAQYYLQQYSHADSTKAIDLLNKSAAQNFPFSANELGNLYSDSTNSYYDIKKAVEFYELGVKNGSDRAMTNLANLYMNGEGVEANMQKALQLRTDAMLGLLDLAEKGDAAAQERLGYDIVCGVGIAENPESGLNWIKKAANQENPNSLYYMGLFYRDGSCGLEKNPKEAFEYFQKAAKKGMASAYYEVGEAYRSGSGVERNDTLAFTNHLKAAKLGNDGSMFNVALAYQNGTGVKRDYKEAFNWYKKCAERGNTSAQNNIGAMYEQGYGVTKDEQEAFKWYMKAAEGGASWSQRVVGGKYYSGTGVEKDLTKAFEWFEKAAKNGDRTAKQNLGICYEYGIGTAKDLAAAKYWYDQAQ